MTVVTRRVFVCVLMLISAARAADELSPSEFPSVPTELIRLLGRNAVS